MSTQTAYRIQAIDASTFRATGDKDTANGPKSHNPPLKFPEYAPGWDQSEKFEPYKQFKFEEPGKRADKTLPNLFEKGLPTNDKKYLVPREQLTKYGYSVDDLTPKFGSEVRGVQLSKLSDKAKDELAYFVAERGVVVFRDQDFRELPIKDALKYAEHFGRQHIHPTSGSPQAYPEVHLIFREEGDDIYKEYFSSNLSSVAWHSDVTYEKQPPGTTFLGILEMPRTGGDTLFSDNTEAYNRLSPEFQKRLEGLKAVHSAHEQADASIRRGGVVRREPVQNVHPIIRKHPATGKKSIFVNPQFTRNIVGLKQEESDLILNFLYDIIAKGSDFHVRARWEDGSVVVWDNRRTSHTALLDWSDGARRHAYRYTPQAEVPYENEEGENDD